MKTGDTVGPRRRTFFLASTTAVAVSALAPLVGCATAASKPESSMAETARLLFFVPEQAAVVEAVVDTFLPKDDVGPGGVELGVVSFIDRRLASGYGFGSNTYTSGPFAAGAPEQGTQSALTPRETWQIGLEELQALCARRHGAGFETLRYEQRNQVLLDLRSGTEGFRKIPGREWLAQARTDTIDGYFCDPIYGGNKGMGAWKMIGFPGPFRNYSIEIANHRKSKFVDVPRGIADLT